MHTISAILQTLSYEEKRNFATILQRKNKRTDTKNIQLLRLLDTPTTINDPDIILYGKKNKGAYHALCKRVQDTLIDFIATQSFETATSQDMVAIKLLRASRIFFAQKQYPIGFKTLKKAAQKASAFDHFSILNEIYYTHIQYAHLDHSIVLDELISAYTSNKEALQLEERLNLFYATVQHQLSHSAKDVAYIISNSLSKFDIVVNSHLSFRSLFKILEIGNKAANLLQDHHSLLPFVEKAYQQINTKTELSDTHLFYHIQIIYYVANAYFRNQNFEKALYYLNEMQLQMDKQNRKYYHRFTPQYTLVRALTLTYTGELEKAISEIEAFDSIKHTIQQMYILDLQLTQAVFYLLQTDYKKAYTIFKAWHHSDTWYAQKAGTIWVIQKNVIEIILHIELDHIDLVDARLQSFKKKYSAYLKDRGSERILAFIRLITQWYYTPEKLTPELFDTIKTEQLEHPSKMPEDIFVLTFYGWLKAKVHDTTVYDTVLGLVSC